METKGFNENEISEQNKEALQSETWQEAKKVMKTEIQHFTEEPEIQHFATVKVNKNDNVYGIVWGNVVREYFKTAYSGENAQADVVSDGITYKVLKCEEVTAFYDADGNTLFDVENTRLEKEYAWVMKEEAEHMHEDGAELATPMGKTIAAIERQAFEQAVENDTDKKKDNEDIASEDCDGSVEETQIKEDGKSEEKVQNSSVYIGVVGAVTKLQEELKKAKEKDFAKPVIDHLIERCKESESLSSDVCQNHKTWEKCFKYIYEQARKQIKGSSGAVRDDVVYEWAEDYYHKDDKAEEEKRAKEAAEKKKKEAEKKKVAEKEPEKVEPVKSVDKKEPEDSKPQPKKNNKDMDGQMDLFSLMGM